MESWEGGFNVAGSVGHRDECHLHPEELWGVTKAVAGDPGALVLMGSQQVGVFSCWPQRRECTGPSRAGPWLGESGAGTAERLTPSSWQGLSSAVGPRGADLQPHPPCPGRGSEGPAWPGATEWEGGKGHGVAPSWHKDPEPYPWQVSST